MFEKISIPSSGPMNPSQETSTHDELLMQQSTSFTDSLKDLKNLQRQLYSAAEYFEASYEKDDHKQFVIESFKEYATKAVISTVDHLGSVASKLNALLDEKTSQFSQTKLRFSGLEHRLQTWQELIDLGGHAQQSLVLTTPKHHKRYMLSAGKMVNVDGLSDAVYDSISPRPNVPWTKQAFQPTRSASLPLPTKKGNSSESSSKESSPSPTGFSFSMGTTRNKEQGKRSVSPFRLALKRSGSVIMRSNSPSSSRTPSEPRRSVIRSINPPRNSEQEDLLYPKKNIHILKALLSMHRPRKEGTPSRFRDDR